MLKTFTGLTLATAFFIGAACGKQEPAQVANDAPPPAPSAMAEPLPVDEKYKVGIDECDQFIAKYDACLRSLPEGIQRPTLAGFEKAVATWQASAKTTENKAMLVESCTMLEKSTRSAMKAQGCAW